LPSWTGWALAVAAILGLVLMVATTVRALLRTDTVGVERQETARASMVAVLVIVVAGYSYALLEAFAGLPRLTAAVPATAAALVWMIAFAWNRPQGDVCSAIACVSFSHSSFGARTIWIGALKYI